MENEAYIEQMIDEFRKKVSGHEKEDDLVNGFSNAIMITYEELNSKKDQDNGFFKVDDNLIRKVLESFSRRHMQMDEESLCREFVKDIAFDKVRRASNKIGNIAVGVSQGKTFNKKIDRETVISKFDKLLDNVLDFNKAQAESLVSEAVLDLAYIENPEIDTVSFRLSHILRQKQEDERDF